MPGIRYRYPVLQSCDSVRSSFARKTRVRFSILQRVFNGGTSDEDSKKRIKVKKKGDTLTAANAVRGCRRVRFSTIIVSSL